MDPKKRPPTHGKPCKSRHEAVTFLESLGFPPEEIEGLVQSGVLERALGPFPPVN